MYNDFVNTFRKPTLADYFRNFIRAELNVFIFLTYFFSVSNLLRTLFTPWKNIVLEKQIRYFSLHDIFHRALLNTISSLIGFVMRLSLITFYCILIVVILMLTPLVFVVYLLFLPLLILKDQLGETEETRKERFVSSFLGGHLLEEKHRSTVLSWAELEYARLRKEREWWRLSNLMSVPPLARDWAYGYTPTLDEYADELTDLPNQKRLRFIWGREKEIDELESSLLREGGGNILIVGDEGVGKTTLVEAAAKRIYNGESNPALRYKRVLKLNMEKALSVYTDQKQRERFFETLLLEAEQAKNVIIYIPDFEKYVSPHSTDLSIPIIKLAENHSVQIIGTTTPHSYEKWIFPNEKIRELFPKLSLGETSKNDAEHMLILNAGRYEKRYRVMIPYETIHEIIKVSDHYVSYIPFPEKAFDLLEGVCVYASLHKEGPLLKPSLVGTVLAQKTNMSVNLTDDMKRKLLRLEESLAASVKGQTEALRKIVTAIQSVFLLHGERKKPLATFLFLGPTGVGKTLTAKALSHAFFGTAHPLIRFDMSNYQLLEDIPNLIGSEEKNSAGLLTQTVRENPYSILLLDELEKAHSDLVNIFLTMLDEGYFTDGYGKRVDCRNLIVIATSNAGASVWQKEGLNDRQKTDLLIQEKTFAPEFLNRFDEIVFFRPFAPDALIEIARLRASQIVKKLQSHYNLTINVGDGFLQNVLKEGYNEEFGLRNLDKIIEKEIESKVANHILRNGSEQTILNI